jgi:hypothetical protein
MPSRRSFLAGAGGTALALAGGAAALSRTIETGRVYQKLVSVTASRNGQRAVFDVLSLTYGSHSGTVYGDVAEEYAAAYDPPATLRVDAELHERLERAFDEVTYLLGFEENGRLSGRVTRAGFDRVGVADDVEVLPSDWYDIEAPNRVVGVTDRDPAVDRREVATYPVDERRPS